MITFDKRYFDSLETANYFGVNEGRPHDLEDIENTRINWINLMIGEGYQLGVGYDSTDDEFEFDAQKCLEDAIGIEAHRLKIVEALASF